MATKISFNPDELYIQGKRIKKNRPVVGAPDIKEDLWLEEVSLPEPYWALLSVKRNHISSLYDRSKRIMGLKDNSTNRIEPINFRENGNSLLNLCEWMEENIPWDYYPPDWYSFYPVNVNDLPEFICQQGWTQTPLAAWCSDDVVSQMEDEQMKPNLKRYMRGYLSYGDYENDGYGAVGCIYWYWAGSPNKNYDLSVLYRCVLYYCEDCIYFVIFNGSKVLKD